MRGREGIVEALSALNHGELRDVLAEVEKRRERELGEYEELDRVLINTQLDELASRVTTLRDRRRDCVFMAQIPALALHRGVTVAVASVACALSSALEKATADLVAQEMSRGFTVAAGTCGACGLIAPLAGGECPDCRH